jgi:non-heme chloroperoxidase
MPHLTVRDGAQIYYKDWGAKTGSPIFFSHGWPLNADSWDRQLFYLASQGFRCVAYDRRGHGRSEQTWEGNNVDTWADDIGQIIDHLDLKGLTLVGHSTGGSDLVRYVTRRKLISTHTIQFTLRGSNY